MKLNDLMTDLNELTKLLADRYNTEVSGKLSLNPENLSQILVTLTLNTSVKDSKPAVEQTDAPDAAQVVNTTASEATSEVQS